MPQPPKLMGTMAMPMTMGGTYATGAPGAAGQKAGGGKAQAPAVKPPAGAPGPAGQKAGGQAKPSPGAPPSASTPGTPATPAGPGSTPFGMRSWYGDPFANAQRMLQQSLAQTRARYAGSGMGDSGREALAEGDAQGAFGANIAQIGEQAYQNDANRFLSANQQLAGLGTGLTGVGANEMNIPGASTLTNILNAFASTMGIGSQSSTGSGGFWNK